MVELVGPFYCYGEDCFGATIESRMLLVIFNCFNSNNIFCDFMAFNLLIYLENRVVIRLEEV